MRIVTSVTSPPSPELADDPVPSISSILTHLTIISPFLQSLRLFFLLPLSHSFVWCDLPSSTLRVLLLTTATIFLTYFTLLYFTLPHCHFELPLNNNLSTYQICLSLPPTLTLPYYPITLSPYQSYYFYLESHARRDRLVLA